LGEDLRRERRVRRSSRHRRLEGRPSVAVLGDGIEGTVDVAADERGNAPTGWLRPEPGLRVGVVTTGERAHWLGPGAAHDGEVLAEPPVPVVEADADAVELLPHPTRAHAEQQTPWRELIDRRELLRKNDRVAQEWDEHPGPDADAVGRRRE